MPRLREMSRAEVSDPYILNIYDKLFDDCDPVSAPGTATGTPGNWWTVFAQVPDAFKHITEGFGFYRSSKRRLDPRLRELGQIRAGYAVGSQFVYSQHCKAMRFVGFTDEQIAAVADWPVADCFSAAERAVLAYADCLVLQRGRVSDGIFAALKQHLDEVEIIELTYVTCTYMMHAVMSRALHLEYDDVAERVVEIAAPADAASPASDVMNMVDQRQNRERSLSK